MHGPEHPSVAAALTNLAGLYRVQGRYAEAEPLYRRSLTIYEKAFGPDYPVVGTSLNNLARLYLDQGRIGEAEPLFKRALTVYETAFGPGHPWIGTPLKNLAEVAFQQGNWAQAANHWRRSAGIFTQRAERRLAGDRGEASGREEIAWRSHFWGLVKAIHRLLAQSPNATAETFDTAQWVQGSEAAAALAQMAARSAKGSPDQLLEALPIGVVVFPGSGVTGNLADKAKAMGIPLFDFRKAGGA